MTELKQYTFDEIAVNLPPKETGFYIANEADKAIAESYDEGYHDGIKEGITRGVNMMVDKCKPVMRALWLARAERAKEKAFNWRYRNPNNNDCLYGINYLVEYDERKIRRTNTEWFNVFSKVERKCRAYADKFKEE